MKVRGSAGVESDRAKIIMNGKITEHASTFEYLGCEISYKYNRNVEEKCNRYCFFHGTVRHMFT
jgi:hypothetical protein